MVQKKVPNKLGILSDEVITEKKLGNLISSSSSSSSSTSHHPESKKKMKKSKSIKGSNLNNLLSPPGEPPPPNRASSSSPNYMKSTSSSHARKELIVQVTSSRNSQPGSNSAKKPAKSLTSGRILTKSPSFKPARVSSSTKKCSPIVVPTCSSNSAKKPAKSLTRTSSLKKIGGRILTKSPSFKTIRGSSTKKCSPIVVPTCSSTMKDSKFPAYLTLNPGGTELEGTSAMKVCPYTYCSLNGHHHNPSPPLKCFLSARRRTLKTQKSFKLGCLSPRRSKKEIVDEESPIAPLILETSMGTSFDIYFAESMRSEIDVEDNSDVDSDVVGVYLPCSADQETRSESMSNPVDELEVEESPASDELLEMDSETSDMEWEEGLGYVPYLDDEVDNSTQNNGCDLEKVDSWESDGDDFHDEHVSVLDDAVEEIRAEEEQQEIYDDEEWFGDDSSIPLIDIQSHDRVSPTSDAFEELATNEETGQDAESSYGVAETTKNSIEKTEAIDEDIVSEEVPRMVQEENTDTIDDSSIAVIDVQSHGQVSPICDAFEELATNEEIKLDDDSAYGIAETTKHSIEKTEAIDEDIVSEEVARMVQAENTDTIDDSSIPVIDVQSHGQVSPTCDASEEFATNEETELEAESSYGVAETTKNTIEKTEAIDEDIVSDEVSKMVQPENTENIDEGMLIKEEDIDESVAKSEDSQAEHNLELELPRADADEGMVQLVDAANSPAAELVDDFPQDFSEAVQEMTKDNNFESQLGVISQVTIANEVDETQGYSSDEQSHSDENGSSSDSEASEEIQMEKEQNCNQDAEEIVMEIEEIEPDAEEVRPTTKIEVYGKTKHGVNYTRSNSNREFPKTSNNLIEIIRCERPEDEMEESKDFNPKEPNYLPVQPDPEGEKVDLKHQDLDERKNAEEWMIDYALQRAVTKLAPARKRKVALLVEAFEAVVPIPKYESRMRRSTPAAFTHSRQIQACN